MPRLLLRWLLGLPLMLAAPAPAAQPGAAALPGVVAQAPSPLSQFPVARPLQGEVRRLRVIVMGDQGTGGSRQQRVAQAMRTLCAARGCDLGVGTGDNFYPAAPTTPRSALFAQRFAALYGPLGFPFLMVAGNHDHSGPTPGDGRDPGGAEAQVAYARLNAQWVMPGRTYRAPVGNLAEFFAVDTAPLAAAAAPLRPGDRPGGARDLAQRTWLGAALAQSSARWKVVIGHHPLFSNGQHGDAGQYDGSAHPLRRGDAVRQLYRLACGRAELLLSGHDHNLQWFAPQPECPATSSVVSGAAGQADSHHPGRRAAGAEVYGELGFFYLTFTPEALTAELYTVTDDGQPVRRGPPLALSSP